MCEQRISFSSEEYAITYTLENGWRSSGFVDRSKVLSFLLAIMRRKRRGSKKGFRRELGVKWPSMQILAKTD